MSDSIENDDEPVTVILPGPASASGAHEGESARPRGATLRWLTIGLLCLMLVALLVVVFVLPGLVAERVAREQPPAPLVTPTPPAPPPAPTPDDKRLAREKREAERLLGEVLRMQTELEAKGVAVWGGQDYEAVVESLAAGDAELQAARYAEAARSYEDVIARLEALRASMPDRLAAAVDTGEAALAVSDGPSARASFEVALAIEPHNARAQQGMIRARVVEDVVALIAAGTEHEERDELDVAREKYAAALALDARSPEARRAHESVMARIEERDFRAAMTAALAALERNEFAVSRAALKTAEALRTGSPEVADARRRLALAIQRSRIESHRTKAQALAREERWKEAGEHYAAALAIDSNAAFARVGRDRSLARGRIHDQLDGFLAEPRRLSAPGPRDNARRLLAAATDVNRESEPQLAAKLERLAKAIEIAETPMQVRLQSDNLTDVTVYKVGRFGRFSSRELMLPPGTYVAVGTRDGYRDVRVEFTLNAGQEPAHVVVSCQEKI